MTTSVQSNSQASLAKAMSSIGASQMLALGDYRFSVDTAAYQSASLDHSFLWPVQQHLGATATPQFVGFGEIKRRLSGTIYTDHRGGLAQLPAMIAQAGLGEPLPLVSGTGEVFGYWCILSVKETASIFYADGRPRRIDFEMELSFYGDHYDL